MYVAINWTRAVIFVILGGELGSCDTSMLLNHHASRHDCPVTRNVSAIQKFADISCYRLLDYQHRRRSDHRNSNEVYYRG
jgi:hypothetical protein